jgi:hypothetical protein
VGALVVLGTTLACRADARVPTAPDPAPAPRLTVTAIAPNVGSTGGGAPVRVAGTGIRPGAVVTFGGCPVPAETLPGSQAGVRFVVATPAHAVGPVDVAVINPDRQVVVSSAAVSGS